MNVCFLSDRQSASKGESHAPPRGWRGPASGIRQKILYFTRTVGFEHAVVRRNSNGLSYSESVLLEMGRRASFNVECTKDGSLFEHDLSPYDAFALYTLGNLSLRDGCLWPPLTAVGKERLLAEIRRGKGFFGFHAAADSFCSDGLDPYIDMIGAEFCGHGVEQKGTVVVTSPYFPGLEGIGPAMRIYEEWYAFKKVSRNMHVILALETGGMNGNVYQRPPMPATWARRYGQGRVFYTALGHREEVWQSPFFQQIIYAGLAWAIGNAEACVTSNFHQATPNGDRYSKVPQEPGTVSR